MNLVKLVKNLTLIVIITGFASTSFADAMSNFAYQVEKEDGAGIVTYVEGMKKTGSIKMAPPEYAEKLMKDHCPEGYKTKTRRENKLVNTGFVQASVPWITVTYKCKKS